MNPKAAPPPSSHLTHYPWSLSQAEHCPAISTSAAFVCQSKEACAKGYGLDLFSERADAGSEVLAAGSLGAVAAETEVAAAADLVYYSARGLAGRGADNEEMEAMRRRVSAEMSGVFAYEDAVVQRKAQAVLPSEGEGGIRQKAAELAAAGGFSEEEGLARALLR